MGFLLDLIYVAFALAAAPWWLRKRRSGWKERFGGVSPLPLKTAGRPRVLLHAVSVGEVGLIRNLVTDLSRDCDVVVSAMTDTGLARAMSLYAHCAHVVRFPFDASFAVGRFLNATAPDVVALVELEVWPNFVRACAKRSVPVAVVNGRLSARSFGRYRKARVVLKRSFSRLAFVAAQNEEYAARFHAMGVESDKVFVAGSMKWDAARLGASDPDLDDRSRALAQALGVSPDKPLIVAGSTAPEEHALLHNATPEGAQLLCAPRRPEWFDDAADALAPCARWSNTVNNSKGKSACHNESASCERFLLDTIGNLREAYALADVVVVGRSFGDLHGSDPMEPAALGKPVLIGPQVEDFEDAVAALERAGALQRTTCDGVAKHLSDILKDDSKRSDMAAQARACVESQAGATSRCAAKLRAVAKKRH